MPTPREDAPAQRVLRQHPSVRPLPCRPELDGLPLKIGRRECPLELALVPSDDLLELVLGSREQRQAATTPGHVHSSGSARRCAAGSRARRLCPGASARARWSRASRGAGAAR
ncbi:hypothetical protein ACFPRL_31895 [Pseudoclavibacter helvolus]